MKVVMTRSYDELSRQAADRVIQEIRDRKAVNLGLATGSTPLGMYRDILIHHRKDPLPLSGVMTFNLDEYVGIPTENPNSFHAYMNKHLFSKLPVPRHRIHLPDGMAADLQKECRRYESLIRKSGGIDIQILGVGENGHIGFNEPGTPFNSRTHVVRLTASTRQANAKDFGSVDRVPERAITMGISTIMNARSIMLLASGIRKAKPMAQLLNPIEPTEAWPVTVLKHHPDVTVIMDRDAASMSSFYQK
ncbi:MAG: glucosamine-6-phosphate deaminase [Bacillaceae bacterium]|nr:glucosamine-6-phosphate deaminase [Bacillaceae bacterium]